MSEPTPETQPAAPAGQQATKEKPENSAKICLSPERASSSEEQDDITPCYVRGYN
jgi:hypothetical protein